MSKNNRSSVKERPTSDRLSDAELRSLAQRMEDGDADARDILIMSHTPLVRYLANSFAQRYSVDLYEDLYQEGCVGLVEATNRFDYRRGVPFSTYASFYVIKRFKAFIRKQDLITLPEDVYYQMQRYYRESYDFYREQGRDPTIEELSEILSMPICKVEQLRQYVFSYLRLDHPTGSGREGECRFSETLHGIVIPKNSVQHPVEVEALLSIGELDLADLDVHLTNREEEVLRRKLGLAPSSKPETFASIGKDLGYSSECIRLVYHKAVEKIRMAALARGYTKDSFPLI